MSTTTFLMVANVAEELQLSELEVRRAIAHGSLKATEISGWNPSTATKKPEWRITQEAFASFVQSVGFANIRLPAGFLDQRSGLLTDKSAWNRLRNAWTKYVGDNQKWERAFRKTYAESDFYSPGRINQVTVGYGTSIPKEIIEFGGKFALDGLAGKIARGQEEKLDPRDPATFTVAQSVIYNQARSAALKVIQRDYNVGGVGSGAVGSIDVLYSTPEVFKNIIRKVREEVGQEQFSSRPVEAELKLEDLSPTTLHFMGYGEVDVRGLLSSADYIKWISNAF